MANPYVITVSSEKGGVGKTTLATNLAIYLKYLIGDLPVTLLSFDNHFTVDRMFLRSIDKSSCHVGHIFSGGNMNELPVTGEHGVQVIPSCADLQTMQTMLADDDQLADLLGRSNLTGIIIIDTSPVLDIFTRNALYAADRVIVPVKDAPSLENCKNLRRFFEDHGIKKIPLRLLPCLIDTRIRYKGPFRDPYRLLKAYAINRGYRCMEGYISKSPKVESLNTNPEGRVYPILTHGKTTDVHLQFTHLARQVYLGYLEQGASRINDIAIELSETEQVRQKELSQRQQRLVHHCLYCGKPLPETGPWSYAFYVESTSTEQAGFVEEDCFLKLVFSNFYGRHKELVPQDSMLELFKESANRSFFALNQIAAREGEEEHIELIRLDETGGELSSKRINIRAGGSGLLRKTVHPVQDFLDRVFNEQIQGGQRTLLLRRSGEKPMEILSGTAYARWQTVLSRTLAERTVFQN